jgi:hypothetical protein
VGERVDENRGMATDAQAGGLPARSASEGFGANPLPAFRAGEDNRRY